MKTIEVIFENEVIIITTCMDNISAAKSVIVHVNALNPADNKIYKKCAGWLSKTMTLHGTANTCEYALKSASVEIAKNSGVIRNTLIRLGRDMEEKVIAGKSCDYKTSHPSSQKERRIVKEKMQKNTNNYTNHL